MGEPVEFRVRSFAELMAEKNKAEKTQAQEIAPLPTQPAAPPVITSPAPQVTKRIERDVAPIGSAFGGNLGGSNMSILLQKLQREKEEAAKRIQNEATPPLQALNSTPRMIPKRPPDELQDPPSKRLDSSQEPEVTRALPSPLGRGARPPRPAQPRPLPQQTVRPQARPQVRPVRPPAKNTPRPPKNSNNNNNNIPNNNPNIVTQNSNTQLAHSTPPHNNINNNNSINNTPPHNNLITPHNLNNPNIPNAAVPHSPVSAHLASSAPTGPHAAVRPPNTPFQRRQPRPPRPSNPLNRASAFLNQALPPRPSPPSSPQQQQDNNAPNEVVARADKELAAFTAEFSEQLKDITSAPVPAENLDAFIGDMQAFLSQCGRATVVA